MNECILNLQRRVERGAGSGEWEAVAVPQPLLPRQTALLLCDVWDRHWCAGAMRRGEVLAQQIADVVERAREQGVHILHAPSDCMEFYRDAPQRLKMQRLPQSAPHVEKVLVEPPLPIDDSDGGCDDIPACPISHPWTRQHPAIRIADEDGISDKGAEVYNYLCAEGIQHLLICGVHTNMCVLKRSFAIRQMTCWGVSCVLVRDLTDAMYNPRRAPFVSHEEGTARVIEHIEKYLCPTVLSTDIVR